MIDQHNNAGSIYQDITDYYIYKRTQQTLVLYSKGKDNVTLINPNTLEFYQTSHKQFNQDLEFGVLEKPRYMLGYSFVPHNESTAVKSVFVSSQLDKLYQKVINIGGSVSHDSAILNGESTIFNGCYIRDLQTKQFILNAGNLAELQEKMPRVQILKSVVGMNGSNFKATPIDTQKLLGLQSSKTDNEPGLRNKSRRT